MDHFNISINLIVAVILTVSPHFFETSSISKEDLAKTYAEAQKQAEHIIKTGDVSALNGLDQATRELEGYQAQLQVLAPIVGKVSEKLIADGIIPPLTIPAE